MPRFEDWLFQEQPGILGEIARSPFSALSMVYGSAVALRTAAYHKQILQRHRLNIPVVAVGNLTLGGSGKTPTALWLARNLEQKGLKPAISIRGYGSTAVNKLLVIDDPARQNLDPEVVGDEACLIARKLKTIPILVGKNRFQAGQKAELLGAKILVLDDGFQHLKLIRDIDVVLVDGKKSITKEKLFPRGRLREPASALNRAHLIILSRAEEDGEENVSELKRLNPAAPIFKMRYRVKNQDELAGKKAFAFAGIADPQYFFQTASRCKIELVGQKAFSDHHRYSMAELEQMEQEAAAASAELMLTTEKDLARLCGFEPRMPLRALEIEPDFFGRENELLELVTAKSMEQKKNA